MSLAAGWFVTHRTPVWMGCTTMVADCFKVNANPGILWERQQLAVVQSKLVVVCFVWRGILRCQRPLTLLPNQEQDIWSRMVHFRAQESESWCPWQVRTAYVLTSVLKTSLAVAKRYQFGSSGLWRGTILSVEVQYSYLAVWIADLS